VTSEALGHRVSASSALGYDIVELNAVGPRCRIAAMERTLKRLSRSDVSISDILESYDRRELELEQTPPFRSFRAIISESLHGAFGEFGIKIEQDDVDNFTGGISSIPPFPEVVPTFRELKKMGFNLCIVSTTEDAIIAGNVAQLGGTIVRVITAEQARAYKPSPALFNYTYQQLGIDLTRVVHICASPELDLAAAYKIGFKCIWIDRGTGRKAPPYYTPNEICSNLSPVPRLLEALG
jgi:2-haloacid dehalogenase